MSEFDSLDTGEALIGTAKKNENATCPEGGDAAEIAGAAIAGIALAGAAAVAAATASMASNGIGQITGATQAAAADALAQSQANATALLAEARQNALDAVGFGPGGEGSAALAEGQTQVEQARAEAEALAGEVRAGVDAAIADAQAAVAAGQEFLNNAIAEGQALLAEGQAAVAAAIQGLTGSALGIAPPLPSAISVPTPGALPVPALPVDVPVASKIVPTEVTVPPTNLAIPSPKNLASEAASGVATRFGVDATAQSPLEEAALSRDEIDECADERTQIVEAMERMSARWQALGSRAAVASTSIDARVESSGPFNRVYLIRVLLLFGGTSARGSSSLISGVIGGATRTAVSRRVLLKGNFSAATREKLEVGKLAGSTQWEELRNQVLNVAQFTGRCEELPAISSAIVGREGEFNSTFQQFEELLLGEEFINDDVIEEAVAAVNRVLPLWETLTGILEDAVASSSNITVTGFEE